MKRIQFIAGVVFGVASITANGVPLFSIDRNAAQLIEIESTTLAVTPIGSLNLPGTFGAFEGSAGLVAISPTELFANLYFEVASAPPYGKAQFYRINTATGNAMFVADVIDGDGKPEVNLAEGLARHPTSGELYISYSSGLGSASDLIGTVNPLTGAITKKCATAPGIDLDHIAFNSSGQLFGEFIGPATPVVTRQLYMVNHTTCAYSILRNTNETDGPAVFIGKFQEDDTLLSILIPNYLSASDVRHLIEESPVDGRVLTDFGQIPSAYHIRDLATVFATAPLPTTALLLIAGVIAMIGSRYVKGRNS